MSKNRLLFISPHMDDAVLSCGGFIGKLAAYGYPVMVLTLFCGSPEGPLSPLAKALHDEWKLPLDAPAIRREEDRRAMELLGVPYFQESFKDCIYRRDPNTQTYAYNDIDEIIGQEGVRESNMIDVIAENLSGHLSQNRWDIIYAPLSIGRHVDHQIVNLAVKQIMLDFSHLDFHFYEDLPYATYDEQLPGLDKMYADYVCYVAADASRKYDAMRQYKSQVISDVQPIGIDIDAIMDYGRRIGARAGDSFGERIWVGQKRARSAANN